MWGNCYSSIVSWQCLQVIAVAVYYTLYVDINGRIVELPGS